jgi:UDP-glucose 4-epimerase
MPAATVGQMDVLVTGGAGFIGSHLAAALVGAGHGTRILDDLTTGCAENVPAGARFIEGDVADAAAVAGAIDGVEVVFHLAAHRAVAQSVERPLSTDTANTHGTLTVLKAAVDAGARRVISSSSSSVYGGAEVMPTPETEPTWPRSPYAVTKLAGEHYCRVFSELFALETVSLRYFNVFGPRQRPDSAYAAVIPRFLDALRGGRPPTVHGDGRQSRAFVYVDDAVAANLAAAAAPSAACKGQAYNVGGRRSVDLLGLLEIMGGITGVEPRPVHTEARPGDIRHSSADISAAARELGWLPQVSLEEGLRRTLEWMSAPAAASTSEPAVARRGT